MVSKSKKVREILFRGKRTSNGEWITGAPFFARLGNCCKMIQAVAVHPDFVDEGNVYYSEGFPVDPETVGHFTGLTDKNGKKIFEGDICRVSRPCVIAYGHIEFKNGCFWFVDHCPGGMLRMCDIKMNGFTIEVIGNIHDNPELLEGCDG